MSRKHVILAGIAALVLALAAFQAGRNVEGTGQRTERDGQKAVTATSTPEIAAEKRSAIFVTDIATVPFADLYDVLRSVTVERRGEWLCELEALPDGPRKSAALSGFFKTLVQLDAKEAIESVDKLHGRRARQIASDAMYKAAPTSAMPEMAKFFLRIDYRTTGIQGHLGDAIEEWSLVDPIAVSHFFDEHSDEDLQASFHTLLFQWARLDPESARAWFERQKPFPDTEDGKRNLSDAVQGFVFGWYNKDPSPALDFAVSNASNEAFGEVTHNLALSLFLKSEDDAKKFIERLPGGAFKAKTVESLVNYTTMGVILGYQDPNDKRSAETMTKWMVNLPEEAWENEIGSVAASWKKDDPTGYSTWLAQQPIRTRDRIMYTWCVSADWQSAQQALADAADISDAKLREKALTNYALSLGSTPDEAMKLLRRTDLSEGKKKYLYDLIRRNEHEDEQ